MTTDKRKILIVDDEKDVVDTINDILVEEGYDTILSYNGKDALKQLKETSPELIILDYYLPEMMGIDVLKELRKTDDDVAVIMMTGRGEEQLAVSLMKAGASDYLKKPLSKFTLLGAVKDVIRKIDINREIVQSERLLLLGELFPFVAHEIRNPLHAIGGALAIIQKRAGDDPLITQSINVVNDEINRLNKFVKECLDFSNPSDPSQFASTDINDIIISSLDLMTPIFQDLSKKVNVSLSLLEDLPRVKTNFNEIKQVFLNIIKNSVEAIESSGTLEVKTTCNQETPSNFITIEFTDSGKGITEDITNKIFDPFFTTKPGGNGLGLPVCRKIICENHHGIIHIESPEGKGTRVMIKLPLDSLDNSDENTNTGS